MSFSRFWRLDDQGQGACLVRCWWRALSGLQMADFSLWPHMIEVARALSWVSFARSLILFGGSNHMTQWPQRPYLLIPSGWGLGFNRIGKGATNIQPMTVRIFYQTKAICINSHFIDLSQEWVLSFLEGIVILCGENHLIFSLALLICEWYQQLFYFFFPFIFISWRLITLQYCSDFCHTFDMNQPWIYMYSPSRFPLPPPSPPDPSGSSQCTRPKHLSHASSLGWWSVSP